MRRALDTADWLISWGAVWIVCGFALGIAASGCAHMKPGPTLHGVTMPVNFECFVHDGQRCVAYRGGQPTKGQLEAMGARAVVKLNLATLEGHDDLPPGVEMYDHPWSGIGPVTHQQTADALADLQEAIRARAPVYVHCTHGVDRTGYLVATYRVLVQHVLPQSAWAEWRRFPREITDRLPYSFYDDFQRETGYHIPESER